MSDLLHSSRPAVSIIIPTYNSEKTLERCLDSIITQQYKDIEVVIMDGMSADATFTIIEYYASRYSYVKFVSEKDSGIYDAMNKGIRMAQGDWVLFLGADDQLYDDEVLLQAAAFLKVTKARFVYGDAMVVGDSSWAKDGDIYDGPFTREKLFSKNICHQAIFYKRDIFDEIGYFNTHYFVCADWDLNFRCFASLDVEYINLIISKFAGGGFSTENTFDDFNMDSVVLLKNILESTTVTRSSKAITGYFIVRPVKLSVRGKYMRAFDF